MATKRKPQPNESENTKKVIGSIFCNQTLYGGIFVLLALLGYFLWDTLVLFANVFRLFVDALKF